MPKDGVQVSEVKYPAGSDPVGLLVPEKDREDFRLVRNSAGIVHAEFYQLT